MEPTFCMWRRPWGRWSRARSLWWLLLIWRSVDLSQHTHTHRTRDSFDDANGNPSIVTSEYDTVWRYPTSYTTLAYASHNKRVCTFFTLNSPETAFKKLNVGLWQINTMWTRWRPESGSIVAYSALHGQTTATLHMLKLSVELWNVHVGYIRYTYLWGSNSYVTSVR